MTEMSSIVSPRVGGSTPVRGKFVSFLLNFFLL